MSNHRKGEFATLLLYQRLDSIGHGTNSWKALLEMGDTSLVGIVDLMTGEKDPRNLMMVFSILKVVMMEWEITNHVEVSLYSIAT